jgi:hypothetical protein
MKQWEELFNRAVKQLKAGKIDPNYWSFGGGTALMNIFNHRLSHDIDIFLADRQLLAYVSPRVNDGAGEPCGYIEQERFVRLQFDDGEIDFIAAPPVTPFKPELKQVAGGLANIEHPVEIIAKKIAYRAENYKPRDIFDLAVVYSQLPADMLRIAPLVADKIAIVSERLERFESSGTFETFVLDMEILEGGRNVRGRELAICRECLMEMEKYKTISSNQGPGRLESR